MGTRSLTFVHDEPGSKPVVCIYQQYDGHFDGVGDDILTFLKGSLIVNGIGALPKDYAEFNGSGDLAARLITHFKSGDENYAGGVYIESPTLPDGGMGTEFAYHIYCSEGEEPYIVATAVYSGFKVEGPVSQIVWPSMDEDGNYYLPDASIDTSGPLTDDQRKALFAGFRDAFGPIDAEYRYRFTRKVLGKPDGHYVSWAADKPGTITAAEADRLLDVLDAVKELV